MASLHSDFNEKATFMRMAVALLTLAPLLFKGALVIADEPIAGVGPSGPVELVHDKLKFSEGPAANERGELFFTDVPVSRIYRARPGAEPELFLEKSEFANGLMFDGKGRLLACQSSLGRIAAIDPATKAIVVVADKFNGKRFCRPNDLVCDRHGGVYFTDPQLAKPKPDEQEISGVYYAAASGEVTRLVDNLKFPNGVILSPDEKTLYVLPYSSAEVWAYDITAPGKIGPARVFCKLDQPDGQSNRGGDGLAVDTKGRLYLTVPALKAIQVVAPTGETLGRITLPAAPTNCDFGDADFQTLYITTGNALYRVRLESRGHRCGVDPAPATGAQAPRKVWPPATPIELSERALALHRQSLVIDGHNDLPYQLRTIVDGDFNRLDVSQLQPELNTDIPRLRAGGVGALFFSAYVSVDAAFDGDAARQTLAQIDLIQRFVAHYSADFALARTADEIEQAHRQGKIAALIGVEGGHSIENSLGTLRRYQELGARYLTLTHSKNVDWADSATDVPNSNGLSTFGEEVVGELNRLGMLVDISHVSVDTMHDAMRISRAPVIASHSSARALAPHPRNVPDEILKQIAVSDGLVMVNFYTGYTEPEAARALAELGQQYLRWQAELGREAAGARAKSQWQRIDEQTFSATVDTIVDHIAHIAEVAGPSHVGLGSDFDGVSRLPRHLEDVSCYPHITQRLIDRGFSDAEIQGILGGNLLRVLRAAEKVAAEMAVKAS